MAIKGITVEIGGDTTKLSKSLEGVNKNIRNTQTQLIFLLRCKQLGFSMSELDLLTIGLINDMFTERENDDFKYSYKATQEDFDSF